MCKFNKYEALKRDTNKALQDAIADLPEATAADVAKVAKSIKGDKALETSLNKKGGFKIASKANKQLIAKAKVEREKSLNTKAGKAKVAKSLSNAKRIKGFKIGKPVAKGTDKGKLPVRANWLV